VKGGNGARILTTFQKLSKVDKKSQRKVATKDLRIGFLPKVAVVSAGRDEER